MKNTISALYLFGTAFCITGCQVRVPSVKTPEPNYYGSIEQTMVINGFPKEASPWIAFSDRSKNRAFLKKDKNESPKEIKFLEPLMVLDHNKSDRLIKVAEYNPDALMKKIPGKSVKSYGWISEDNLLLWDNALRDRTTGFIMKAAIVPSSNDVIKNTGTYIKNDSAVVYSSPNFAEPLKVKIPVGQLVYVYKKAADNKGYLVGKTPKINLENPDKDVYGWVSAGMLSTWGERSAIRLDSNFDYSKFPLLGVYSSLPEYTDEKPIVPITDAANRNEIENIFPTSTTLNKNTTKYFTNAFDYSQNYIFNVLGEKLSFNRYKEITRKNKNLNIVFAIDISAENRAYSPVAKSIIQDMQMKVKKLSYYKNVKYSVVLYKNNTCGSNVIASVLSSDTSGLFKYIDDKTIEMRCEGVGGQPVNEALGTAGQLLSTVPDETNLIVLVGSTASTNINSQNTVRFISKAKAKIIAYQTRSGVSDMYNDFVLLAENTVGTTARNITELNKEKIADQSLIMNKNNFNFVESDLGVYSLDYPKNSMTQGFVIYPKKREDNSNTFLIKALDSLLLQVTDENKATDKSLTAYFKTDIGSNKTYLDGRYSYMFPGVANPLPSSFASELVTYNYPSVASGYLPIDLRRSNQGVQKGILISEKEYEALRNLYDRIYKATEPDSKNFSQSRAISRYVDILRKYNPTLEKVYSGKLYDQPMRMAVASSTGFDNSDEEIMSKFILSAWKDRKTIDKETVRAYFKNYKELENRLLENRNNPLYKIEQNGTTFYWLNEYFMPFVSVNKAAAEK
ncbi:type VI secretion system protein TssR domain-containing protein [Elizabethkingia meningoseptica]|uniref:type VI secretion system protein TssR domain-containing protein n=1 Tax=Elizabethkingia meningoseptica TaxID=238 RepID=UPI002DD64BA1|nr:type VI secretion system protein TssR domain-containing protein [Elizabethkingia meningoseptica]MEC4711004.1 type VI secretion system protein TssR domain-containing protein [Elizabethkingia meningoseptica]